MDIVTIDFETYYDPVFSLSKMTTESYIRSPQFQVIGVGVKVNNHPTDWYTGENPGSFLNSLDYSNKAILCHHTAFDGAILSWHFGIRPRLWLDTLSMARPMHSVSVGGSLAALTAYYGLGVKGTEVVNALGKRREDFSPDEMARYAEYCINDVEITRKLFDKLKQGFPASELLVIDQTLRMYTEPVIQLDVPLLQQHLVEVNERKAALISSLDETGASGEALTKMLMSNDIFAQYLKKLGVEPPVKTSLKTGKQAWAFAKTDKGMTDLLDHPDDRVQAVVTARLGVKSTIEQTRTEALIGVAGRGALPIMLNYYGAHTGRFSGGDKLNLQNLPARGNNTIRRALKAPEGHMIIACDSSQIEARVVAWLAKQEDLLEAFRQNRDVYSEFASEVYGRTITKADKVERFVGKTCILGLGYGMGAEKFRRTLEIGQGGMNVIIDLNEAERIVRLYRQKNFRIVGLWSACGHALSGMVQGRSGMLNEQVTYDNTGVTLPNTLKIQYHGLRQTANGFDYIADVRSYRKAVTARVTAGTEAEINRTKIYGGKMTENVVQALAALVIREQMAAARKHGILTTFQVHDEIVTVAASDTAAQTQQLLESVMSTPPVWAPTLPVACESGMASNYGDT
jgi:DNA polymerase I-like protein with 3'-5' exonuclease and polymerase domains